MFISRALIDSDINMLCNNADKGGLRITVPIMVLSLFSMFRFISCDEVLRNMVSFITGDAELHVSWGKI
jgi:hypothetical protein